ncbi:MAG: TetM/TetW/TetO/TetS family tetracycline resistance ribosomal protection protein [Lachnospiraceae bacterium]|nr:TetM/TetW/TetO/TetS family tetracycline resistance ribosomal protection protein [Lachnospiraceae bacterium]
MEKTVIGILAHVDAGKTTLSEGLLYLAGKIRKLGRVDHGDAFLDSFAMEKERGITIFSKQAQFSVGEQEFILLDTPGHVDFSAEMERTLQVLDYAILVISGSDGIQGHTDTLWKLLKRYQIPVFIFINKMDLDGTEPDELLTECREHLDEACIPFFEDMTTEEETCEKLALCDEKLLELYMKNGGLKPEELVPFISRRKIFPCFFGSALKMQGISELLNSLHQYCHVERNQTDFGARVYKITRDNQGSRLTYLKVMSGVLKVKMPVGEEKIDQIRIYAGGKYETVDQAEAGSICAVTGLGQSFPGQRMGIEQENGILPVLEPVLQYQVILSPEDDVHKILQQLRLLEEEYPELYIEWNEQLREIHAKLMGEVQIDILKALMLERFGVAIAFGPGAIVYKETIADMVEGIGHFEPLRHYAEVHLLLEPAERGTGLQFATDCSEDILDRNWQRLIVTHLEEKTHLGVLTGSPITDMKITLITGKAHTKHTEGGDFRQATYRAIRQGLKKAHSILLEPWYQFRIEVPEEMIGRAMSDVTRMNGSFDAPETIGGMVALTGQAPVSTMENYQQELLTYSRGKGKLFCTLKGYEPCHNSEEVELAIGYDSEADLENPTGSVFCAHGAGFLVPWNQVEEYMHLEGWKPPVQFPEKDFDISLNEEALSFKYNNVKSGADSGYTATSFAEDKELEAIFARTFGPVKRRLPGSSMESGLGYERKENHTESAHMQERETVEGGKNKPSKLQEQEYLLVDGYNIIFAWEELSELAKNNLDAARMRLMDILCNYQGYRQCILILVFDAYKVKGNAGEIIDYHNIHVVFTKEAETADMYIEKVTHEIARKHHVTVATSDGTEQVIIMGQGAYRMSAGDLKVEIDQVNQEIRQEYLEQHKTSRNYLFSGLDAETAALMEDVRLGNKEL